LSENLSSVLTFVVELLWREACALPVCGSAAPYFSPNWKADAESDARGPRVQQLGVAAVCLGHGAHDGQAQPSPASIASRGDESPKQRLANMLIQLTVIADLDVHFLS
jgi:hypothetical protein